MAGSSSNGGNVNTRLQAKVTCPNCWHPFSPEDVLWIAEHEDLIGDPVAGPDQPQRFLPSAFTADAKALDVRGCPCHRLACPRCHLEIPWAMLELKPTFISVLGAPSSGKSCFLTSMIWQMRHSLPADFDMSFSDADVELNRTINEYERLQFMNANPDELVAIRKTETEGEQYESVKIGQQSMTYLRPFIFTLRPLSRHPNFPHGHQISTALCIYDNAGEHFLPGQDSSRSPVTRHLSLSDALLFLFDPTQDAGFRAECGGRSADPQFTKAHRVTRQESILLEAGNRIRVHAGLSYQTRLHTPLMILVTKYDAWASRFEGSRLPNPWSRSRPNYPANFDLAQVQKYSHIVRKLLVKHSPQIVSAAEDISSNVTYIPVSSFGGSAEEDEKSGMLGIRPQNIHPMWTEVPLLYTLCRTSRGMIPRANSERNPPSNPRIDQTPTPATPAWNGNPEGTSQQEPEE